MESLLVAALQMNSGDSFDENLETIERYAQQASEKGANLLVLPENCVYFGAAANRCAMASDPEDGEIGSRLSSIAKKNGLIIVAAGVPERNSADSKRPFNSSWVYRADGSYVGGYRKIHLFDVEVGDGQSYRESESTSSGEQSQALQLDGFKLGLSICYDIRFPELFRELASAGAQIITVGAAFTKTTGMAHWEALLRARAIENQTWLIAAAQSGGHPGGKETFGHTMIIDPWGKIVQQLPSGVGLIWAQLDFSYQDEVRKKLPSLALRLNRAKQER